MAIDSLDEAKAWVAKHQELNLTTRRYSCKDPFEKDLVHTANTTGELVLKVVMSYKAEASNIWRRRLGVCDF